jgi:hypothetical protein
METTEVKKKRPRIKRPIRQKLKDISDKRNQVLYWHQCVNSK